MSNTSMTPKERAALAAAREADAQRRKRINAASQGTVQTSSVQNASGKSAKSPRPNAQNGQSPRQNPQRSAVQGRPTAPREAVPSKNHPKNKMNTREYPRIPLIKGTKPRTNGEQREDTGEFPSYVRKGKGSYHPQKPKSRKVIRRRKKLSPKVLASLSAVGLLLFIMLVLLIVGVRYKGVTLAEDYKITFFGISRAGEAESGWLSYPGGERGRLSDGSRIKFSDGSTYEGEMLDVARDGRGILTFASGDVYEGEFEDDLISGYGKMSHKNGDVYEGEFENGLRDGNGTLYYSDGSTYEGGFKGGRKNGYGVFSGENTSYEGYFVDDLKEGTGKHVFLNGDFYEGEYKNDMRNGRGRYTWADGGYYEGQFKDNIQHGEGIRVYASGVTQEGRFENGLFVG